MPHKHYNIKSRIPVKLLYKSMIFIGMFFVFHIVPAQTILFKNYSVKDGLASSEVYNVMQDSKGFMWFCTDNGVSRFDGYEFKNFSTSSGLPDINAFEAYEDHLGRIWFRSRFGKLSYYFNDSIFTLPFDDTLVKILRHTTITSMSIDSMDNIYLGLHGAVYPIKIDMKNHCTISYIKVEKNSSYICQTPSKGIISGLFIKSDSIVDPYSYRLYKLRIYDIDGVNDSHLLQSTNLQVHKYITEIHDKAIIENHDLFTTLGSRFLVLDDHYKTSFLDTLYSVILNLVPYNNGAWIISSNDAPVFYSNGTITRYPVLEFLKDKHITSMYIDKECGFWFTSLDNGVYYLQSINIRAWTTENGLPGNKITYLTPAPDSSIWATINVNNKIAVIHKDSLSYRSIPFLPDENITGIFFNPNKRVWISTTKGIRIFKNRDLKEPVGRPPFISTFGGYGFIWKNDSSVWFNTQSSIFLVNTQTDSFKIKKRIPISSGISKICDDREGGLWISTINGMIKYQHDSCIFLNHTQKAYKENLDNLLIKPDKFLFGVSPNGLFVLYHDHVYHITTNNGLISNYCKCLSVDYNGNLWIGTDKGLSHVLIEKETPDTFQIASIQNLRAPYFNEANCITIIGNLVYVGTNNGLSVFDMSKTITDTVAPPVYITHIKINTKYIPVPSNSISLHYDENYISINYVGLSYTDAGNMSYRYKLQGIDTGWVFTKNTNVQYPKLASGSYIFLVSARNADGTWSKHPASFSFVIDPPLWDTWWAKIFYGILVAGLIYWRIKTVEIREKRKTEINRQLVAAEIRELRANFDPHFLFNSLNTLTYLVENKEDKAPEFVSELSKFYRYTLQFREHELMDLENEIKQARRYIHLIKIRFGEQFIDTWNVEEKYLAYLIPTYSLQLLLENIIKHNIIVKDNPLHIEIEVKDDMLTVKNDLRLKKADGSSTGHGLESINERYRLLAGKKITISQTSEYFCVSLPLISENYESPDHRRRDTGSESA